MVCSKKRIIQFILILLVFFLFLFLKNECFASYDITYGGNSYALPNINTINFNSVTEFYNKYNATCDFFITYETRRQTFLLAVLPIGNTQKVYRFTQNGTGFATWDDKTKFAFYFYDQANDVWYLPYNQHYYDHIGGYCLSTINIYAGKSTNIYYAANYTNTNGIYVQPSFITTASQLNDFENLQYLEIKQGDFESSIYLSLSNSTTNNLIFRKKLTDYEDYIERENLNNPFSSLIYRIPISALPSFSLNDTDTYDFTLTYYNENDILSNISVFFNPSINQTVNNTTNSDINNSIDETAQKIDETNEKLDELNDNITSDDISRCFC